MVRVMLGLNVTDVMEKKLSAAIIVMELKWWHVELVAEKEANVVFIAKEQAEKNVFLAREKEANVVVCVWGQE